MVKKKQEIEYIIDDEFQSLIPPLSLEEFTTLENSIIGEGCRDPLVIWDNIILDGHNRYSICMKHGLIFKKVEKNFDNREHAKIWILENQLGRRNLNEAQRIDVVDRLFGLKEEQDAKDRQGTRTDITSAKNFAKVKDRRTKKLGDKAKVSHRTYEKGKKVKESQPELWQQCLDGDLSIDKAYKEARNIEKDQKRTEKSKQGEKIELKDIDFRLGDFTEVLDDIPDGSVDLILTDPPYPIEFIECWSKLADFAYRKLKKNGFCIAYCGHKNLYESMKRMEILDFYWIFSLIHSGNTKLIAFNNICAGWKPILVYQKGFKKLDDRVDDIIHGTGRNKKDHDWQQGLDELDYLIDKFSKPGNLIVEPFAGSGTTLISIKKNNRIGIGAEENEDTYNIAKKRISDAFE